MLRKLFGRKPQASQGVGPTPAVVSPYAALAAETQAPAGDSQSAAIRARDVFLIGEAGVHAVDTVALFYPEMGTLLVRDPVTGEAGRLLSVTREPPFHLLFGDWDGKGRPKAGFYHPDQACFALWSHEDYGQLPDNCFLYGVPDSDRVPLVGDWNGDGKDGIGLYAPDWSCFLLRDAVSFGEPDLTFIFGKPGGGFRPLIGDWTGLGHDSVGLYHPDTGQFLLRSALSEGAADFDFKLDRIEPTFFPLVGDWNGDGADGIGCFDPKTNQFYLTDLPAVQGTENSFRFGARGVPAIPLVMSWNQNSCAVDEKTK